MADLYMTFIVLINLQKDPYNINKIEIRDNKNREIRKVKSVDLLLKYEQTDNFINMLSLVQEEVIYVILIVAPFILMCFTRFGEIQQALGLTNNIFDYAALFSFLILMNSIIEKIIMETGRKANRTSNDFKNMISSTESHIALGLIVAAIINYATSCHPNLINSKRISTLSCWFIFSRSFQIFGCLLNLLTKDRIWNVFGDSMTFFVILTSLGLSFGFDSFLIL